MVPCSCGKGYIGKIGRYFNIILMEHAFYVLRNRTSKYSLVEHACSSPLYICVEEAKLIKKEHYLKIKMKEPI